MIDKTLIGQRIKGLRVEQGYSIDEFATEIGLTSRFIYDIESGRTGVSLDKLVKISNFLNTPVDFLLFGDKPTNSTVQPEILLLLEKCPEPNKGDLTEIIKSFILSFTDNKTNFQSSKE